MIQIWYYSIFDNTKILCKHYDFMTSNIDAELGFEMTVEKYVLKNLPQDGCIFCKNCGECSICIEKYSEDEGFFR